MKPSVPRPQRQFTAIEVGRRIATMLEDAAIQSAFDDMERRAIEAMIAAASAQDREREALRIQVIREFKTTLEHKAREGERAHKEVTTNVNA